MKPNNLVDVAPDPPVLRRASFFHFIARSASQNFSTFRPQGEGLFTPSPILSVDHVTAEEQLRQDVRSLREKHRKLETDALWEAGSVVAKITAGRAAVAAIDVLRRQVELLGQHDGAIEAARNRSLRNRVIGHLFGAETVFAPTALSGAEGVTALDVFHILTDVRSEIRDIERRLRARLSPFQRDAAESGATYSVIVVSGTETRRRVQTSPEGVVSHQEESPRSVTVLSGAPVQLFERSPGITATPGHTVLYGIIWIGILLATFFLFLGVLSGNILTPAVLVWSLYAALCLRAMEARRAQKAVATTGRSSTE
jgi:hypothetical protein